MGFVQQAVLEFDEEIQAPWRPRLVAVADVVVVEGEGMAGARSGSDRSVRPRSSGRSSSRVGVCRPRAPHVQPGGALRSGAARRPAAPVARQSQPYPGGVGHGRLRLTRRARRLAWVLALAVGVALGSWLAPAISGGDGDLRLAGVQSVVVKPGDTLWSIAADAAGSDDVRAVVDRIQALNGLSDAVIVPGQVLELP